MAMKVNGMLLEKDQSEVVRFCRQMKRDTHRSTDSTTRNGQFNALVRIETVDAAVGEQIRRIMGTAQELEQDWDGGGHKGNAIN